MQPAAASHDCAPDARSAAPRILLADDNPAKRAFVRASLGKLGAEIVEADCGAAALRQFGSSREFAVVILDVHMPDLDGFEVARQFSERAPGHDVPIIFYTATRHDYGSRLNGYGLGAVDYLIDPVDPAILRSKVRVFLELYRSRQLLRHEIEERRRQEELARHLASHDPLTGLPNRTLFADRLEGAMLRADRAGTRCALCYVDLDGFKPVNDRHGHQAGDALLKAIAARLLAAVRKGDSVARLGGDEFAAVLEQPLTAEAARLKAEELVARLSEPCLLELGPGESLDVRVGASAGIAIYPDHGATLDRLIRSADAAMYQAKQAGKGRCVLSGGS